MSESLSISCNIRPTDLESPLGLELWVDNQQIFNSESVTEDINFNHNVDINDGDHVFTIRLKNKLIEHTIIDDAGKFVKNSSILVEDIAFEEIKLGNLFTELAVYTHDFNGTGEKTQDKFFSELGCNGDVTLKFTSPFYMWLLEHL